MDQGKQSGSHYCKDCHCFRGTVKDVSKFSPEEKEDRRYESTRVSDTYPEDEISYIDAPSHRIVYASDSHSL